MKIVLYANSFLPNVGGREIVMHYLARAFKTLGHEVRVLGPSGFWKHRRYRFAYPVHRWPQLRGLFKTQVSLVEALWDIRLWGCDILHAHNTYPSGEIAARLKRKLGIPLVITPHGVDIHVIPEIGFGQRLDPVRSRKIAHALQGADVCTAISQSIERSLMDAGAPLERIRRIPNGVDFERFQDAAGPDIRQRLGLAPSSTLVVTVGNYHPRKGQDILVQSMPMILERHPGARLIVVGGGTETLKGLVAELSLTDKVFLLGAVGFPYFRYGIDPENQANREDLLAAVYRDADLYVSAGMSEGAEGLSLAVIEAMAAGLPILASDISGNRDLIQDGLTGWLFPPNSPERLADAVISALDNDDKRKTFAETGKRAARRFDWINIARQYLAVYDEALETARQGRSGG